MKTSRAISDPYTTQFGSASEVAKEPEKDKNEDDDFDAPSFSIGLTQLAEEIEENMRKKIDEEARQAETEATTKDKETKKKDQAEPEKPTKIYKKRATKTKK